MFLFFFHNFLGLVSIGNMSLENPSKTPAHGSITKSRFFFQNTVVFLVSETVAEIMWVALKHKHIYVHK